MTDLPNYAEAARLLGDKLAADSQGARLDPPRSRKANDAERQLGTGYAILALADQLETLTKLIRERLPEPAKTVAGPSPARRILELPMAAGNDAGAATVREYLAKLLAELWKHGEAFSGKRPFGCSDWDYDLYRPLIEAGAVEGQLDEDGNIAALDSRKADELIAAAVQELGVQA